MELTLKEKLGIGVAVGLVALVIIAYSLIATNRVYSAAPSGLQATVATTSNIAVTTTQKLVFATSTCAARIVSTKASAITITFSDNPTAIVPTGAVGHVQAASTTVVYDSGLYGCGALRIYSYVTDTITVAETR